MLQNRNRNVSVWLEKKVIHSIPFTKSCPVQIANDIEQQFEPTQLQNVIYVGQQFPRYAGRFGIFLGDEIV